MKMTRYTETQIIKVLKEVESGRLVKEVCREYGISDATYYNWNIFSRERLHKKTYVERFNRTFRDEILNMYVFKKLNEERKLSEN